MLRMDLGSAVRALAARWVPDELSCRDLIYAVLLREAVPALHQAMLAEDPKAARASVVPAAARIGVADLASRAASPIC